MKHLYLISIFLFVFTIQTFTQCPTNILMNGSFTCEKGEDKHGPEWNAGSTPDVNDVNGEVQTSSGYSWINKPMKSRDGGTWQNLYSNREYLEQTIKLNPGQQYTLQFEYASMGIKADENYRFDKPVGIQVYIDDNLVFETKDDKTPYTWEMACYVFVAKKSSTTIRFSASDEQYVGIDGVCLVIGNGCNRIP